jgi:O-antigen chain-terminating methyltransferase
MSDKQAPTTDQALQEHFRGSEEEIRRRLSVYLPLLEEAGVRELDGEILDIGFGRGEWLILLADNGYRAAGVDGNPGVVAAGEEAGLAVSTGDAIETLASRADASLAAVTAFHVVEHLDPRRIAGFIRQIHRCLVPGGLVILETPNPENVTMGASSFYIDPDHVRPVPPPLLGFYAREAGFTFQWIARVNHASLGAPLAEVPPDVPGALQVNAAVHAVNTVLFAAPDYALVAQKDGGRERELDAATCERVFGPPPLDLESYRVLAAEDAARRSEAEKAAAQARAEELAARAAGFEEELRAARELAGGLELRAADAQMTADTTSAGLEQSRRDFATVAGSLSWRVTRPLRLVSGIVKRPRHDAPRGGPSVKHHGKLAVGYPMRWALSHPRLGASLDRGLAKLPTVERKVRMAVLETEVRPRPAQAETEGVPSDLVGLPVSARTVVDELERTLGCEGG